jgi:magnesium transporter
VVRASLVTLLDEPELIGLGRQMDAEDFADLVQDLPRERVDAVLAQLGTEERAEVRSVLSFPEGSVGALMQLDVVTVRADVSLEDTIASLRRRGRLPRRS